MITLKSKIDTINKIGKTIASRLNKINIKNVEDALWHLPFRYDDFSDLAKIKDLEIDQVTTVRGTIELLNSRRARRRKLSITEALITDETGSLKVVWFNQPYITQTFKVGDQIFLAGKVSGDLLGRQMTNPSYEKVKINTLHTARLVPIYSSTTNITQKQLRFIIQSCLPALAQLSDWLPDEIKEEYQLIDLNEALEQIHFPENKQALAKAEERLQFDELFLLQMQQQLVKQSLQDNKATTIKFKKNKIGQFVKQLPFALTNDQKKAAWEIIQNMEETVPMNRLLNGDVGSGKTVVALLAAYSVTLNQKQAAIMAPTTILAQQHMQTIHQLLPETDFKYCLLTNKDAIVYYQGKAEEIKKKELIKQIKEGEISLVIGTHALIQKDVEFKNLSLIIIDEQHRFGVDQRSELKNKSGNSKTMPHFLSMTATPIPRTLALVLYGDLDISLIKAMPAGRQPIITKLVEAKNRAKAYDFINQQIATGRQVFVICPLIDPSDKLGVKSVTEEFEKLDKEIFPHLKIDLLHGKLKPKAKSEVMSKFQDNKTNILVSTSVVEVGVDIPNATVMMIEGADRFGLAQLHQFRGRVGRGQHQSYCFLFTDNNSGHTIERLKTLTTTLDGFALAEADLKYRGSGNIYGTMQSGYNNQLIIQSLANTLLLKKSQDAVKNIIKADPKLKHYPKLRSKIAKISDIHLE
ncbi:MAG: ATP-dependent DNA helicase RecG [Candidatus Komeilibacteria bacterium]